MSYYLTISFWITPDALSGETLMELARLNDIVDVRLDTLVAVDGGNGGICLVGRCCKDEWDTVKAFCKDARTMSME